jgi:hypothetical protein
MFHSYDENPDEDPTNATQYLVSVSRSPHRKQVLAYRRVSRSVEQFYIIMIMNVTNGNYE